VHGHFAGHGAAGRAEAGSGLLDRLFCESFMSADTPTIESPVMNCAVSMMCAPMSPSAPDSAFSSSPPDQREVWVDDPVLQILRPYVPDRAQPPVRDELARQSMVAFSYRRVPAITLRIPRVAARSARRPGSASHRRRAPGATAARAAPSAWSACSHRPGPGPGAQPCRRACRRCARRLSPCRPWGRIQADRHRRTSHRS
jgi:hypothetical protein